MITVPADAVVSTYFGWLGRQIFKADVHVKYKNQNTIKNNLSFEENHYDIAIVHDQVIWQYPVFPDIPQFRYT